MADARAVGVNRIATVGMDDQSIERALAAAASYDCGRRRSSAATRNSEGLTTRDLEPIERAAADPRARAIGETGLDYFRDRAPHADQRRAFEAQSISPRAAGCRSWIHTREAEDDTFDILRDRAAGLDGGPALLLGCPTALDECVERGYMCSFAGNVTYKKATDSRPPRATCQRSCC